MRKNERATAQSSSPANRRLMTILAGTTSAMFLVEFVAGHVSGSLALRADALDCLDDALFYASNLAIAGSGVRNGRVATVIQSVGVICGCVLVLLVSALHLFQPVEPNPWMMGVTAAVALVSNTMCARLSSRLDAQGLVPTSADGYQRHDSAGNIAVIVAAAAVFATGSYWPDALLAVGASGLLLHVTFQRLGVRP